MSGIELLGWAWPEIGAAFALAAGAIVALHLVRLRRRVVIVPWVALFREALPEQRTTRLFRRLSNLLSLLLALLVAALVALALGLPRLAEDRTEQRTLILVIDTSASMQARLDARDPASTERRFDRAKTAALARLAALSPNERVLVLAASAHAAVVHPMTDEPALAAGALRALEPTDAPGDATEAMRWANRLCAREACTIEVFTDGGLAGLAEARVEAERAGLAVAVRLVADQGVDNVAITALSARRFPADPSRAELLIEIASFSGRSEELVLSILVDDALSHREALTLAPGATVTRTLDELTGADALFEARLSREDGAPLDALAVDDVAWARLAPRRRRRAALVAPPDAPNVYLEAALLLDPYLDVVTLTPEAYETGRLPRDRELAIFDRYTPESAPTLPSILLAPGAPARAWLPVGEPIERPRFDAQERGHPLLAFVALRDVNAARATPLVLLPGDESIAGEVRGALLSTGAREGVRFVALGLDVRESDLPLRIAWPILLLDAVAFLLPDDLALAPAAQTGRAFRLAASRRARLWPRGDEDAAPIELAPRDGAIEVALDRAGVYVLREEDESGRGEAPRLVVANLFARDESRLAAVSFDGATQVEPSADRSALEAREERGHARWPLHALLVLGALGLLALEWLTFHRRWTT
jgi:hypothetical protein